MSTKDVHQCLLEMLLAGTDTSSVSMYYALVAIAADSQVDQRIYEELQQVLGSIAHIRICSFFFRLTHCN